MNNIFVFNSERFKYGVIKIIFITIFVQQIFVINLGGSLKIYEIMAIILLVYYLIVERKKLIYSESSFILFLFFVVSPILSLIYFFFIPDVGLYYKRFPEMQNILKFNIYVAPFMFLIYNFFNWITINYIIGSKLVYLNFNNLIKTYIVFGSLVSVYSLYQFVGINLLGLPDVIPSIIDYRNFKDQGARVTGFSIEPGTYVIMVAWICLYLTFLPKIFSNKRTKILLILNYSVLILTFSTALIAFFLSIIVINLFFMNFFNKIKFIFAGIVVVTIIIFLLNYFGLLEIFQYVLQYKVENFFRLSTHTLDSGAMRSYTSRLGLEVFKDYPLFGVGAGNSYYFMWLHEFDLGITRWGETLSGSLAPQNAHAKILAERGLFGYLFFILFFILYMYKIYKIDNIHLKKIALIGGLMTFMMFLSIYPIYSLFIWIHFALVLNYIYNYNKKEEGSLLNEF